MLGDAPNLDALELTRAFSWTQMLLNPRGVIRDLAETLGQAGNGNDAIVGGPDTDLVLGGQGNDTVRGHDGWDWLFGGPGIDKLYGGGATDEILSVGPERLAVW